MDNISRNYNCTREIMVRYFDTQRYLSEQRNRRRSHRNHQKPCDWPAALLSPVMELTTNHQIQKMTHHASCYSNLRCILFLWKETYTPLIAIFLSNCTGSWNQHFPLSRAALIGVLTWCVGPTSFSKIVWGLTRICNHQHEYYVLHKRETNLSQKTKEHLECFWKLLFKREGLTGLQLLSYLFLFDFFHCRRSWDI